MLDRAGRSRLHYAAKDNDAERVRSCIAEGLDVSAPDRDGWTPLHFAAQECALEAATLLIDAGAKVDAADLHGNTPLFRAVFNSRGRGEMIALLRKSGANPGLVNKHGLTPVSLSRTIANFDVAQFFADWP